MKNIATSEKEYFDSYDENKLNEAFESIAESITKTDESEPISSETQYGKVSMENEKIFKPGQNVEIYRGEYQKGSSQPYHVYSWNEFINLKKNIDGSEVQIVEYDETSGILKFDLGKYMESEGMLANEKVTIRLIDPITDTQLDTLSIVSSDIAVNGRIIEINEDDETQNITETTKTEVVQNTMQTTDLIEEVEEKVEFEENSNKNEKQDDIKQDEKTDIENNKDTTSNDDNTVNEEITKTDSEVKEDIIDENVQIEEEQNIVEENSIVSE